MPSLVRRFLSSVAAVALVIGFSLTTASNAAAGPLQWKTGVSVTHAHVFNNAGAWIDCVWSQNGVSSCIRFDRSTIYVRSDSADGHFKLGQFKKIVGGATYRCQNNNTYSAGNHTWVGCNFSWPKVDCYDMQSGYGEHDWYVLNSPGQTKCFT